MTSEKDLAASRKSMVDVDGHSKMLLLDAKNAARLLGIGERFFWGMHSSGELGPLPIRLGTRTLWSRFELEEWVKARCPRRGEWAVMKGEGEHATV
jgi:predicted DNA-binding transcriptional regulator AlpA